MIRRWPCRAGGRSVVFSRAIGTSQYKLTCGLEVHAQLMTKQKLFSNSNTSFHAKPNSQVSYYDAALPGTQPVFNWNALGLALKAAVAVDCTVAPQFSFDRKHYFYGDQPAGYQITQHYEPFATNGHLTLFKRDGVDNDVDVRIKQIQIEQDTGKSTYLDDGANIDLNRTNTGLIEIVTEPDIPTPESAGIFVRKLQTLLRHLEVCSGELETGSMRVDVNVSVNGGQRCEVKNLFSTSAVVHAIKAEFSRQVRDIESGKSIASETRGWDGKATWKLRGKENVIDYRYMPDPELQPVSVDSTIVSYIRDRLPVLPDELFVELLSKPYSVPVVDARTIMAVPGLREYYKDVVSQFSASGGKKTSIISNWIVHRLCGELNQLDREFAEDAVSAKLLTDLILQVERGTITKTSGALILKHLVVNGIQPGESISSLIESFDLGRAESSEEVQQALVQLCEQAIDQFPDVVARVKSGKPKSIKFLVGQVMKQSQGRVDAAVVEEALKQLLEK